MVDKRAILDALEFGPDGLVSVRLRKQVVFEGEVLKDEFHRTVIPHGTDAAKQMGLVNAHLEQMGYSPVPDGDIAVVVAAATERQAA